MTDHAITIGNSLIPGGITLNGNLDTTAGGTAASGANVTLDGAVALGAGVTITTGGGALTGGAINFLSTIDGPHALTLNSGTGAIHFNDTVGQGAALTSLTVAAETGTTFIQGTADAITTTGTQTYGGPVTLDLATDLKGTTVTFDKTVNGAFGLTITGAAVFNGEVGTGAALASLDVTGAAAVNTDAITTTGTQIYGGAVTLGSSVTMTGSTMTFDNTVNGAFDLTITGAAAFNGEVGKGTALTSLDVTGATTVNTDAITTTGTQEYGGAVTLDAVATTLTTGTTVTFDAQVNGDCELTIAGAAIFNGEVGNTAPLASLDVTGETTVNTDAITTAGTQEYGGALTLGDSVTMTGTTMTFDNTVDGAFSLTVAGDAVFNGYVGSITPLTVLDVKGKTTLAAGDASADTVSTTGDQMYAGAVTLTADTELYDTGSGILFKSTVDSNSAATPWVLVNIAPSVEFDGEVGHTFPLGKLVNVADTIIINTDQIVTTTDDVSGVQVYVGPVQLGPSATDVDLTGTTVVFTETVDGTISGHQSLTVSGDVVFRGDVGDVEPLKALEVTGTTALGRLGSAISVTTTGDQTYVGAVTLHEDTTLTDGGLGVFFLSTVDSHSNANHWNLTVDTPGTVEFGGPVGSTYPLGNLTTEGVGTTEINGGSVTTTGFQLYQDNVVSLGAGHDADGRHDHAADHRGEREEPHHQ